LPHLLHFTDEHRTEADTLQNDLDELAQELEETIDEIWRKPSEDGDDQGSVDSWAKRMEDRQRNRQVDPTDKIGRPEINQLDWKMKIFNVR
jgi:elongator complex protein 1